ncbi:hypothetical protein GGX14DRAFT_467872 [Mycena pura]|uniref:F-box domain-containing protein n=1 Tax=Mycena pura TaxID=153505 RepID=A0AAD6V0T6_9AGAR|nr:hypothetical protein GGX14DRAFT_467872 [Mycena pura]
MAIDNEATGVHHRAALTSDYGDTDITENPAGAPLLSVLAMENILSILACCDICSVVTIAQTCRYMHALAFSKSVWLVLVKDLQRRSMMEADISVSDLSMQELIDLVKRILSGPETWSFGLACQVSRRVVLHPEFLDGALTGASEAKLLSDGRHVLFKNRDKLECWDVVRDTLVWRHRSAIANYSVIRFAVQTQSAKSGDNFILLICGESREDHGPNNHMEIVALDPQLGTHVVLATAEAPAFMALYPSDPPVICNTVVAVALDYRNEYFLYDWHSQRGFLLLVPRGSTCLISLIPGHIILKARSSTADASGEYLYVITTDAAFHMHGTLANTINRSHEFKRVSPDALPTLLTCCITTSSSCFTGGMSVHVSPARSNTYRIWVYLKSTTPFPLFEKRGAQNALLCSYELTLSASGPPQLRERSRTIALPATFYRTIAYSGHMQVYDATRDAQLIVPPSVHNPGEVDLEDCEHYVDVSPYSGALTYATAQHIVILYFK